MKLNRPSGFLFATFCSLVLFAGCVPATVNTEEPNGLVASPKVIALASTADTGVTSLALKCGCRFKTSGISYTGDTTAIRYAALDDLNSMLTPHLVKVFAAPGVAPGTYHSSLIFSVKDDTGKPDFHDTVNVSLVLR